MVHPSFQTQRMVSGNPSHEMTIVKDNTWMKFILPRPKIIVVILQDICLIKVVTFHKKVMVRSSENILAAIKL